MKRVVILGSTGSIGCNALDVIAHHPDRFEVFGLAAGSNAELLAQQKQKFRPTFTSLGDEAACIEMASHPKTDLVLSAIVGVAGLKPTYAALQAGKTVALANKESLVAAGPVMDRLLKEKGGKLIPVDSEHSAIHQIWSQETPPDRIILTASGGPFRNKTLAELEEVTLAQALQHPNWKMGNKVTIDSATLMNKGLEMIEAHWLFGLAAEKIDVVIHPQSIIHSMVEYKDGSVLAQLGMPDMRIPIGYALAWPDRITTPAPKLNFNEVASLTFEKPDTKRFPGLRLAKEALVKGHSYPCVLNAANEVAVRAFLQEQIRFLDIPRIVEKVLSAHDSHPLNSLEDVLAVDRWAREQAWSFLL